MEISAFQNWVSETFGSYIDGSSREYGLGFLLEQSGQLAQAIIHDDGKSVEKELTEVLLVVVALAVKEGVALEDAVKRHLTSRRAEEILSHINK